MSVGLLSLFSRAAAASGAALVLLTTAAFAEPAGDVTAVKGEVAAEAQSGKRALAQGNQVFVAETVTTGTGARVTLSLAKNTSLKLGENARLKIDKALTKTGAAFDLKDGALLFDRGVGGPKGPATIKSSYGLMAVRGTKFFAGPSNGVFGVLVLNGRVDVTGGGHTVRLTPGLGTNIKSPGDKPTKPGLWKPARIKAALSSVQ